MEEVAPEKLMANQSRNILLSGGSPKEETVKLVNSSGSSVLEEMEVFHEEANTRIVYHAIQCDREFESKGLQRYSLKQDTQHPLQITAASFQFMISMNNWVGASRKYFHLFMHLLGVIQCQQCMG